MQTLKDCALLKAIKVVKARVIKEDMMKRYESLKRLE